MLKTYKIIYLCFPDVQKRKSPHKDLPLLDNDGCVNEFRDQGLNFESIICRKN